MHEKIIITLSAGSSQTRVIKIIKKDNSVGFRDSYNGEEGSWQESSIAQWRQLEGAIKVLTDTQHDTWSAPIGDIILKLSKVDNTFSCTYQKGALWSFWDVSIEHHTITKLI